ncbi:hypothetical protein B0O99DRAFT_596305 [Bisporella sp. PMI_857]|nr:hypothetical protein B0O99DRAFT_596305 [Bisporella sp. PMI_857]
MSSPPPSSAKEEAPQKTKDKILAEINERLKVAREASAEAEGLRKEADGLSNDVEGEAEEKAKKLEQAFNLEKKAAAELKVVNRLQSGVWQGGAAGAGIGAGVAGGLGTVVGALVGGVVSIPTTGLGLLAGAGTGAIHGPWVKVPGLGKDGKQELVTEEEDERKGDGDAAAKREAMAGLQEGIPGNSSTGRTSEECPTWISSQAT